MHMIHTLAPAFFAAPLHDSILFNQCVFRGFRCSSVRAIPRDSIRFHACYGSNLRFSVPRWSTFAEHVLASHAHHTRRCTASPVAVHTNHAHHTHHTSHNTTLRSIICMCRCSVRWIPHMLPIRVVLPPRRHKNAHSGVSILHTQWRLLLGCASVNAADRPKIYCQYNTLVVTACLPAGCVGVRPMMWNINIWYDTFVAPPVWYLNTRACC